MLKVLSSVSISVLSLGLASSAYAQIADDPNPGEVSSTGEARSTTPNTSGIEDVIVTAQRRTENVQETSLAIQVLGAEDLQRSGVVAPRDLNALVPGVQITQAGAATQTYLRGVGDFSANGLAQLAVSYNIDGVNIDRATGIGPNFYDLARIEVLKGPQGTLYGRNATGGAVNLITNRPGREFGGYLTAEYGNYDSRKLTGALNVPVGPSLAMRAAFQLVDRDGYLSDGTDDDDQQAARLQLLWEPNDVMSLRLSGDYADQEGNGSGTVAWRRQPGTGTWTAASDPINNAVLAAISGGIGHPIGTDSDLDNTLWNVSAELNVKLADFATLTVLPAYRHQTLSQRNYNIGFQFNNPREKAEQTSLEVRLGNQSEALKWVVGGYYFDADASVHFNTVASIFVPFFSTTADLPDVGTKSYAAFGEATLSVTDRLRVIGGLRHTTEKKNYAGTYTDESIAQIPPIDLAGSRSFDALTWKAGLEYDAGPASMLYLTASEGFKSGGFFTAAPPDNSYDPEQLTAFSLGSRNRFLDNRLQVNAEAYYWRYRDQQVSAVGYTSSGMIVFATRNAGASNPYGVDLDVVYKPWDAGTISASLAYIRAKYKRFEIEYPAALAAGLLSSCPVGTTPQGPSGVETFTVDCSGFPLVRTPKWSGNVNYQHVFGLGNGADVTANVGASFASARYLSIDFFTPTTRDGDYVLANADVTYDAPGKRWSFTAYIKNIGDTAYYLGNQLSLFNGQYGYRTIGAPRTYGVRATLNF